MKVGKGSSYILYLAAAGEELPAQTEIDTGDASIQEHFVGTSVLAFVPEPQPLVKVTTHYVRPGEGAGFRQWKGRI